MKSWADQVAWWCWERDLSPSPFPPKPSLSCTHCIFHILIRFNSPTGNHWLLSWTGIVFCLVSWTSSQRLQRMLKQDQDNQQYCHLPPSEAAVCYVSMFSLLDLQPQLLLIVFWYHGGKFKQIVKLPSRNKGNHVRMQAQKYSHCSSALFSEGRN